MNIKKFLTKSGNPLYPHAKDLGGSSGGGSNNAANAAIAASKLDEQLLPAYEREYYALPGFMKGLSDQNTPEGKSSARAGTRGAQVAQENRINQIRAKHGGPAFNPIEDRPGASDPTAQAFLSRNLALANGASPQDAAKLLPDKHISNYRGYIGSLGPAIQAQSQRSNEDIDKEIAGLQPALQSRYSNDAVKAGTLSNSAQSQASLNADVQAGLGGAKTALKNDQGLLQAAMSPDYASNTKLFPSQANAGTPTPNLPVPNAQLDRLPQDPSNPANLLSGGKMANKTRMGAIQARRTQ